MLLMEGVHHVRIIRESCLVLQSKTFSALTSGSPTQESLRMRVVWQRKLVMYRERGHIVAMQLRL